MIAKRISYGVFLGAAMTCGAWLSAGCLSLGSADSGVSSGGYDDQRSQYDPSNQQQDNDTDWFQLSPDDSTSMASAQRFRQGKTCRYCMPHEVINYYDPPLELRTQLRHQWTTSDGQFVGMDGASLGSHGMELLIHIYSPLVPHEERRPWNIHLCVDVSGSMRGERIDYTRLALLRMLDWTKPGDRLSLTTFATNAKLVFSSRSIHDHRAFIEDAIKRLKVGGTTNMKAGLDLAYEQAQTSYDPNSTNRVLLFSDGNANVGDTDYRSISRLTRINKQEGIYLSGVGVGNDYAMARMDRLTDAGKGAHVFLPNAEEMNVVFGRMMRKLIEVSADEVSVELRLPKGFEIVRFSGEETSTDPNRPVQNIVLASGDDLTMLAAFHAREPALFDGELTLTYRYTPLSTEERVTFEQKLPIAELLNENPSTLMERTRLMNEYAQYMAFDYRNASRREDLLRKLDLFAPSDSGLEDIANVLRLVE